jgi:DNA polymerase-3 subunit gamma/tau
LNDLAKHGKDLGRLVADLLGHFRNLLIYQVSRGDLRMLEVSEAEGAALKEQSSSVGTDALTRIMEVLSDCEMRLRDAASKKILVEVALLKAIEARQAMSLDSVLQQLQSLRSGGGASGTAIPSPAPARAAVAPAPAAKPKAAETSAAFEAPVAQEKVLREAAPTVASAGGAPGLQDLWSQLVDAVGRASPFTRTYLLEAHPVSMAKNLFTIGFDPEFEDHIGLVDNSKNHTLLQTKLSELGHPNMQIKFIKAERPASLAQPVIEIPPAPAPVKPVAAAAPATPTSPAPKPVAASPAPAPKEKSTSVAFSKDDFKDDPLIQKALEVFKGKIVDVRS